MSEADRRAETEAAQQRAEEFEAERARLTGLATRILGDPGEAEDAVQQAWLRLHGTTTAIDNLPAWLTTVTSRLCLDRLRARRSVPEADLEPAETAPDPAEDVVLADTVGIALQVVLDRLTPNERVAFVLHDSFGFDFPTIAAVLGTSDALADWEVVDAFLAAARGGDFTRLVGLLAPDAVIVGDEAAVLAGTPRRIDGRDEVATFFDGAAQSAFSALVDGRPGAAWYLRGEARVAFDFTVVDGQVTQIAFRAAPELLAGVVRREGAEPR